MIDLHTHILPDIDDGSPSLTVSLELARLAVEDGITTVVATPHSPDSTVGGRYSVSLLNERFELLREALQKEQIPLNLVRGTEITIGPKLVERLRAGELLPYENTRVLLIECPGHYMNEPVHNAIFALQAAGYRVLLAHPERLQDVQHDPEVLRPLVERGVMMQLTGAAIAGEQNELLGRTSHELLRRGLVHVVASDGHGFPPRRRILLKSAYEATAKVIGQEAAHALCTANPEALLADKPLPPQPPIVLPKKRWLW
jgi:Capsular polysaccharide biosynthesis protein